MCKVGSSPFARTWFTRCRTPLTSWRFGSERQQSPDGEQKVRFTPQVRERPEWKSSILPAVQNLIREMGEFHQQLLLLEKWLESLDEPIAESLLSLTVELNALIDRLELAAATLGEIFGEADSQPGALD